jgi:hypothetical protein
MVIIAKITALGKADHTKKWSARAARAAKYFSRQVPCTGLRCITAQEARPG